MCRCLQCPRLTVHKHLMASLIIFYTSNIIYLEPYILTRSKAGIDYRLYVSITDLFLEQELNRSIYWIGESNIL